MTAETRARQNRQPEAARLLAVVAALALIAVSCQRGQPGGESLSPETSAAQEVRESAERDCRLVARLLGLEELAAELGSQSADPEEIATAYSDRASQGQRVTVFEGCLTGVRAAAALEEEGARIAPLADQAAERAGCTDIRTTPNEGQMHILEDDPVPQYATAPAASGPHRQAPLPAGVPVYHEPVDEAAGVHNLEHGYVLIYYRAEEPTVAAEVVAAFEGLAGEFDKVIVAPYPGLPPERGMAMVAWRRLQRCPASISAEDAELVARSFVLRFAGTDVAPEPFGP